MEQGQSLRQQQTQKLAMTQELRQAISLLQLNTSELAAEMQKAYLENPVLEINYNGAEPALGTSEPAAGSSPAADDIELARYLASDGNGGRQPDYFLSNADTAEPHENVAADNLTLEQMLRREVGFALHGASRAERLAAAYIVSSLDDCGYLQVDIAEVARAAGISAEQAGTVLRQVQHIVPAGIAARDLRESLQLQAQARGIYSGLLARLIEKYLPLVAEGRIKEIAAAEQTGPREVQLAIDRLRSLDPKPGCHYGDTVAPAVVPDVIIEEQDGTYTVRMADGRLPSLTIASAYRQALRAPDCDEASTAYIRERLNAAHWLLKSINQRRTTILRVARELVARQSGFIRYGASALEPLTMQDIATALDLHESTVSRAVAGKYAQLPRGIVPLKEFFTNALRSSASKKQPLGLKSRTDSGTAGPEDVSAAAARAAIKEIIAAEDARHPLSDAKLTGLLAERHIVISRRTVMKYREQLGIPSSVRRKRY